MGCGTVRARPWGLTLASFATARARGQLTLTAADGRLYGVAFRDGAVVGASSPHVSDSAVRVALTSQLVTPAQAPMLARAVKAAPERDEVEVIAAAAGLSGEEADRLRRRVLAQRVARTFAVERGGYVFGETITVATMPGIELEVGPAILLGVRMNLSGERLAVDLRRLGARFALRAGVGEDELDPARFGLTEQERPILLALREGTSLPELEARHRELEPRLTQAVIYTLVAVGLCEGTGAAVEPVEAEAEAEVEVDGEEEEEEDAVEAAISRARTTTYNGPRSGAVRREQPRTRTVSSLPPPVLPRSHAPAVRDVVAAGLALLDAGADHFALLGIPHDAAIDTIRAAYVSLACRLQPEKLPALEPEVARDALRLFAPVNLAYGVLSDPVRRADYLAQLRGAAGGAAPVAERRAGTAIERARAAADFAQRGMHALRREDLAAAVELLTRATELAPHDVDHAAQLAWVRFCASSDKPGIAAEVRRALERAIFRSARPALARFYLGRVERMLGRVREALHHFHEVQKLEPGHADAAAEIRLLAPRAARR